MPGTPRSRLRLVAICEGISYLLLLLIAMPLKYVFDIPIAVSIVGGIHGGLFVLFCLVLLDAKLRLPMGWGFGALVFLSSIIPFGFLVMDPHLRRLPEEVVRDGAG